jgi:hypothetical protein
MADRLKDLIMDCKAFLYSGLRSLPISIGATLLIIGLCTSHYAFMFFLIGYLIVAPGTATILNMLISILVSTGIIQSIFNPEYFKANSTDVCNVVIPYSTFKNPASRETNKPRYILTSEWMAMTFFFFGYILTNAVSIFKRESDEDASSIKIANRKTTMGVAIFSICVFILITLYTRYQSGCEPSWPIQFISVILFGVLGYGWYVLLSKTGEDRLSDLFGIANRILAPSAFMEQPATCEERQMQRH